MAKIIDGKKVSAAVRAQVRDEVVELVKRGVQPGLAVVIVGNDPASRTYVNNKKKACADTGIYSEAGDHHTRRATGPRGPAES